MLMARSEERSALAACGEMEVMRRGMWVWRTAVPWGQEKRTMQVWGATASWRVLGELVY
jgi:hypothetical protein